MLLINRLSDDWRLDPSLDACCVIFGELFCFRRKKKIIKLTELDSADPPLHSHIIPQMSSYRLVKPSYRFSRSMLFEDSCPKSTNYNEPGASIPVSTLLFASVASVPAATPPLNSRLLAPIIPTAPRKHLPSFHVPPTLSKKWYTTDIQLIKEKALT